VASLSYTAQAAAVVRKRYKRLDFAEVMDALERLDAGDSGALTIIPISGRPDWARVIVGDWRILIYVTREGDDYRIVVGDIVDGPTVRAAWPFGAA
jgi:hypothetical protein